MKDEIMQKIKNEKIQMRPASLFLAQKLGLQSVLALMILASALLLNIFLYFLKKTGLLKFMIFGWPGLKIVLLTLPYDYIALFIVTIILANYIIHQFDLSRGISMNSNVAVLALLSVTFLLGSFFAFNGIESALRGWSKNAIPADMAVSGRLIEYSDKYAIIQDETGRIRFLDFGNVMNVENLPNQKRYEKNKVLRAVGKQDAKDEKRFHAELVDCCDEE